MKIVVSGEKSIAAIQQEFQEEFPFLRVDFFQPGREPLQSKEKNRIPANKTFEAFKTNSHSEHILITPSMTVAELEEKFKVHYGLSMQIFRKSGKVWLETTLTDTWTLQEQNEQGKALSGNL
jgi:hypothetical protein